MFLGAIALVLLGVACWKWSATPLLTVGSVGTMLLGAAATALFGKAVMRVVEFRAEPRVRSCQN